MLLLFKKDGTYLENTGTNSLVPADNQPQLLANKADIMARFSLSEADWDEMKQVVLDETIPENKETISKLLEGYIPELDKGAIKKLTKSELVLTKEARLAANEQDKVRLTALKSKLEKGEASTAELQEALAKLIK